MAACHNPSSTTFGHISYRGARVHIAADDKDGITIYEAHAPEIDVIITDVDMPVMNGLEFVRHVRGLNTTIPIIVSTGLQDRSRIDCFRDDFGVEHFLDKPFTVELLCEELLGVLSSS